MPERKKRLASAQKRRGEVAVDSGASITARTLPQNPPSDPLRGRIFPLDGAARPSPVEVRSQASRRGASRGLRDGPRDVTVGLRR